MTSTLIGRAAALWLAAAALGLPARPAAAQSAAAAPPGQTAPAVDAAAIDRIFERWDRTTTPGCAVGVALAGQEVYARGFGMAN
ncbi:MAG: hypothetical protein ACM3H9_02210, partial [Rhodospirillaceae bacterium]